MKVKYVSFVGEAVNSGMDQYNNKIDIVRAFFGLDLRMNMA